MREHSSRFGFAVLLILSTSGCGGISCVEGEPGYIPGNAACVPDEPPDQVTEGARAHR